MRRVLLVGVAVAVCACAPGRVGTVSVPAPTLSRSDAEQLMLKADDVKRSVLDGAPVARLADVFSGRALQMLEAQAATMDLRLARQDERSTARVLVLWDSRADEAVLQVAAQRRLVTSDQPNPAWASTVRQWWARLQHSDAGWRVVEQHDLPPDQWRPAPAPLELLTGWVPDRSKGA